MTTVKTFENEAQLQEALQRGVCTRIEMFGELVSEPGMSEDERQIRLTDVLWRHGGAKEAREAADNQVQQGRWTAERAEEHVRRLEREATVARALVIRCDEERAKRGATGRLPQDG